MEDIYDIVKNIDYIYNSDTSFKILKDYERVLDTLGIYVYENWMDGELVSGPKIDRHWISCKFMWPRAQMPDPMGGKRLLDYDCKVKFAKSHIIVPRNIREPDDIRPGTKKGKLDRHPIWIVEIIMPKKLVVDIYTNSTQKDFIEEPAVEKTADPAQAEAQPADLAAGEAPAAAPDPLAEPGSVGAV